MKAAVVVLTLIMLLLIASAAHAQKQRVSLAATTVIVREAVNVRSDVQLLWNREIRSRPIGHAVLSCFNLGSGGLLGRGLFHCTGTYVLPLGKIMTQGLLHSYGQYTMAVTGGTGSYANTGGQLFGRRVAAGVQRLVFSLE